jgi:ubiquitin-hydrolase Zn-finger-containing protein
LRFPTSRPEFLYRPTMQAVCTHTDQIDPARPPGADVCAACVEIGSTWVHLRQCLICGATNCCDSSPNRHATKHFFATDHPIMQTLEPGEEWAWCFVDRLTLRAAPGGSWRVVDPFFDAGLVSARREIAAGRGLPFPSGSTAQDGFPLAIWESTYRGRHRAGSLDPDQAADLEGLPGWEW